MARKKLPYKEGDWLAVPLRDGGFGIGVAARANGRGLVLGYFFGPRHDRLPTIEDTEGKRPNGAILIAMFGDLGMLEGRWKVIGKRQVWCRQEWSVPPFARIDELADKAWRVHYDDSKLVPLKEEPVKPDKVRSLPEDGTWGAVAVESWLTRLLAR